LSALRRAGRIRCAALGATLGVATGTSVLAIVACSSSPSGPATVGAQVSAISGQLQSCLIAGTTGAPLVAKVTDAQSRPVTGAHVAWTVQGDGATLATSSTISDSLGLTSDTVTVGPGDGAVTVGASVPGGTSAASFLLTSTTTQLSSVTLASPRVVVIDSGGSTTPNFAARDTTGHPVAAPCLSFTSRSENAPVTTDGVVIGALPGQAIVVAQGPAPRSSSDSLLVLVAARDGPVLMGDLDRFGVRHDSTIVFTVSLDMHRANARLGAATVYLSWDPRVLRYQSDAAADPRVPAVVNNRDALTSGLLSLATASDTGFAGVVRLRRVTFVSAAAGHAGTLALYPAEVVAAGNFAALESRTVAATYPIFTR
jgi:hypothetical protein